MAVIISLTNAIFPYIGYLQYPRFERKTYLCGSEVIACKLRQLDRLWSDDTILTVKITSDWPISSFRLECEFFVAK